MRPGELPAPISAARTSVSISPSMTMQTRESGRAGDTLRSQDSRSHYWAASLWSPTPSTGHKTETGDHEQGSKTANVSRSIKRAVS